MKYCKILTLIALITACSIAIKCDNDTNNPGLLLGPSVLTMNRAPVADAGVDKNIILYAGNAGSADLDGSKSYDPDGKNLAYSWTVRYRPAGSAVSFSQSSGKTTSFTFDMAGTYEIMLTVNNGSISISDMVTVDVAVNSGPMADAGSDREATIGDTVTLDGSGSADPENDILTHTWTQIYGPTIGTGILTGSNPSFTAPSEVCTIVYDLRVDDGSGNSPADRVYIFVMKKGGTGIYVATGGDDANDGTDRAAPKKTVHAAITAARTAGSDVYMSAGVYDESVTLANGVSIYGGFDPSTWVRDSFKSSDTPSFTTSLQGGTIAMDGNGVTNVVIDGLSITSANAVVPGEGSYAVRLINSTVELKNCIITAGNGAPGVKVSDGVNGMSGNPGEDGEDGYADVGIHISDYDVTFGGDGGTSASGIDGGKGGMGGHYFINYPIDADPGQNGLIDTPGGAGGTTSYPRGKTDPTVPWD